MLIAKFVIALFLGQRLRKTDSFHTGAEGGKNNLVETLQSKLDRLSLTHWGAALIFKLPVRMARVLGLSPFLTQCFLHPTYSTYRNICYDIDRHRWNKIIQMKRRSPQNTIRN